MAGHVMVPVEGMSLELAAIYLPKELVEEARRRGLDLEAELLDYLATRLELNPTRRAELHLALAERLFEEGALDEFFKPL